VIVPDNDFQQLEYSAVWTALGDAGYSAEIANAEGVDSVSGDVHVRADLKIADAQATDYVGVVIIGGPGAADLFDNEPLQALVTDAAAAGDMVAAICLAPVVLARAGVLDGKQATVWADKKGELEDAGCAVQDEAVVVDGRIITGNGPDAAGEFAEAVVKALRAED
jgi:protease I